MTPEQRELLALAIENKREAERLADTWKQTIDALAQAVCPHKIGDEIVSDTKKYPRLYLATGKRLLCVNVYGSIYHDKAEWRAVFALLNAKGEQQRHRHSVSYGGKIP